MEPVSVSQVQAYLACPLKYRFQYIDRIPAPWRPAALAFGSSIHSAIEWFHRERLAGRSPTIEDVIGIFEADWYAANLGPVVFGDRESKEGLGEKGAELLRLYVIETDGALPARIEERFEVDLVDPVTGEVLDVRLHGAIDLIDGDTLVDLKTRGTYPRIGKSRAASPALNLRACVPASGRSDPETPPGSTAQDEGPKA
jgi:putative RecB family exonuclease